MARTRKKAGKRPSRTSAVKSIWHDAQWTVGHGRLIPRPGRPGKIEHLFRVVAEKVPIEALEAVRRDMKDRGLEDQGVYVAHDSMGYARYAGRGWIFGRLRARAKASRLEIKYFSFYVVRDKIHEREVETLVIRVAGPMLYFNERKKRLDLRPGNIRDYEPGTQFYARHYKRGRKTQKRGRRSA